MRLLKLLFTMVMIASISEPARATVDPIKWYLYPPDCVPVASASVVTGDPSAVAPPTRAASLPFGWYPAGRFGVFYFGEYPPASCAGAPVAWGVEEVPDVYPVPGNHPPDVPCDQGSCFSSPGAVDNDPWMAVIDWDNAHGWAVGQTALLATDPSVHAVLFPLTPTLAGGDTVTDADVIIQLGAIAELIDDLGLPAPATINMSLGRRSNDDDARTTPCSSSNLSCQMSRLIHHLERGTADTLAPLRTVVIAAAGNHRVPLFPATIEHVLAAGSLELLSYRNSGEVIRSWETPAHSEGQTSLMPGTGLCLPSQDGKGHSLSAGSSFSTAITSAMIADALVWYPQTLADRLLVPGPIWEPHRLCIDQNCSISLARGLESFPTPSGGAQDLIDAAMYDDLQACGESSHAILTIDTRMTAVPTIPHLSYPSLVELVADTHQPQPEPSVCEPCSMTCEESPFVERVSSRGLRAGLVIEPGVEVVMTIDSHAATPLPPGMTLAALYIRHGAESFEINLSKHERTLMAKGEIAYLHIKGTVIEPAPQSQPSLISLIDKMDSTSGEINRFWQATPMPLNDPIER